MIVSNLWIAIFYKSHYTCISIKSFFYVCSDIDVNEIPMLKWSIIRNTVNYNIVDWCANCFGKIMKANTRRIGILWDDRLMYNFIYVLCCEYLFLFDCLQSSCQSFRCNLSCLFHMIYLFLAVHTTRRLSTRNFGIRIISGLLKASRMIYIRRPNNILWYWMTFLYFMQTFLNALNKIGSEKRNRVSLFLWCIVWISE